MSPKRHNKSREASSEDGVFPIKPKQLGRFYEPIVLFKALTEISAENGKREKPEVTQKPETEEEKFHTYIDKMANLCDTEKGGKTVAACVVLDEENTTTYAFACNRISAIEARYTKKFLLTLLNKIEGASKLGFTEAAKVRNDVFSYILTFNRPRVKAYASFLQNELCECIKSCNVSDIETNLKDLKALIGGVSLTEDDDADYFKSFLRLLRAIKTFLKDSANRKFMNDRAEEGRVHDKHSLACWSEFRHNLSRLCAYEKAVPILFEAEKEWPQLFQMVKVIAIPSIPRGCNPLGKKRQKAESIIGRMISDPDEVKTNRNYAQAFQPEPMDLDGRIQIICESKSFKPTVHCEILILEWVVGKAMAPYLFNGYKYIGTSKGACRLCNCYFEAHPSKIQARGSHGNLYPNWAFPPVLKRDGTPAQQRRQKIINYIIEKIRRDTLAVLKDKSTMGKRHDSNTYDMSQADDDEDDMQVQVDDSDTSEVEDEGPDEIAELTERLNGNLGFTSSSTEETFPTSDFEDEDGDEEGGDEEGDDEDGDDEDGDDDEGGAIL